MDFFESRVASAAPPLPYLADALQVADATQLIANFGENAGCEAAARAEHYRVLATPSISAAGARSSG